MSLREDAIRAYREKNEAKEAEQAESKKKSVVERIAEVKERICKAFQLTECPTIVITPRVTEYWPEVAFEVEGIGFSYDLSRDRMGLKVACPKCSHEWHETVRIETDKDGVRDLSDLGYELCALERHDCPSDRPPYVPTPPPQTATYRVDSVECRLLDTLREYVNDAIDQEMEGR